MRELSWTSKNLLLFLNTRNNWGGGRLIRTVGDRHRMRIESLFPSWSLVLNVLNVWKNIICVRQLDNSTCSQTHKVDNNGINANFLFPYIYCSQRSWGKVIFSEACVKNCVQREGVCPIACWDTSRWTGGRYPPRSRPLPRNRPPGADPPGPEAGSHPPPPPRADPPVPTAQRMLENTGNKRAVRILLECNLLAGSFIIWILRSLVNVKLDVSC